MNVMADQEINASTKRRGRPATGKGVQVVVRLQPELLSWLDDERAKLDPEPTRPEFIRFSLEALRKIKGDEK